MTDSASGKAVYFDARNLHVELDDGRVISTPLHRYPELQAATLQQLGNYLFVSRGTAIKWPQIDYQLSIEQVLAAGAEHD